MASIMLNSLQEVSRTVSFVQMMDTWWLFSSILWKRHKQTIRIWSWRWYFISNQWGWSSISQRM